MKDIAYRSNPEKDYLQPCAFATTDTHMDWIKAYYLAVMGVDMIHKYGFFCDSSYNEKSHVCKENNPLSHPGNRLN